MLHSLKHTAARLWLSLLAGLMPVLLLVPLLPVSLDLHWLWMLAALGPVAAFFLVGWFFNRLAERAAARLVREALIWERSGNFRQAERVYQRAVAVFDSFLVSPKFRGRNAGDLVAHLARFYLASPYREPASEIFISAYFRLHPDDKTLAEEWLQQTAPLSELSPEQQETAFRIGEAQPQNYTIQETLARSCLSTERIDYQAIQTYRRILEDGSLRDAELITGLADLFFANRRTDGWALKAYVMACDLDPAGDRFLKGVAACLHWSGGSGISPKLLHRAERLLSSIPEPDRRKMREGFRPPARISGPPAAVQRTNWVQTGRRVLQETLRAGAAAGRRTVELAALCAGAFHRLYQSIRDYDKTRTVLKWSGVVFAGIGLLLLAANTMTFLLRPKQEPAVKEIQTLPVITDPFTLQVAAYLKKEHAERYVDQLKSQGLDAYWNEAKGVKKQWYQVKISHFPDKASAREYGESLKAKGIIEDFYVANYRQP